MGEPPLSAIAFRIFKLSALVGAIAFIFFGSVTPRSAEAGVPLPIILNLDSYSISHDQHLSAGSPMSVLANDENIPVGFVAVIVSGPLFGTLGTFDGAGNFEYDPPAGFVGQDTFLYTVVPNQQLLGAGDVTAAGDPLPPGVVEITMTNSPAQANDDAYTIDHDTNLNVGPKGGLVTNDFDPDGDLVSVFDVFSPPSHGTIDDITANGAFIYIPDPGYVGTDIFEYQVTDGIDDPGGAGLGGSGKGADEIGVVTITITGPTPTPVPTEEPTAEPTKGPGEPTATPEEPAPTATTDPDDTGGVTELPDTGAGPRTGVRDGLLAIALFTLSLTVLGFTRRFKTSKPV